MNHRRNVSGGKVPPLSLRLREKTWRITLHSSSSQRALSLIPTLNIVREENISLPTQLSLCFDVRAYAEDPAFIGSASQAMFLNMLSRSNPAFSNTLHEEAESDKKPFSIDISELLAYLHSNRESKQANQANIPNLSEVQHNTQKQTFALRVGFLDDAKASSVHEALLGLRGETFRLTTMSLRLSDVRVCRGISSEAMAAKVAQTSGLSTFTVHFKTPAVFRRKGHYHCLPQSDLLFADLSRRMRSGPPSADAHDLEMLYQRILPAQYEQHTACIEELYQHVLPDSYQLYTADLPVRKINDAAHGFQGICTYRVLLPHDAPSRRVLAFLLLLMPFTGVGYKTAMGLGAVDVTF